METEIWKDFHGYQVSNLGRVIGKYGGILKPGKTHDGYLQVGLCINGTRKFYKVHRLVALLFIDNPENKPQVNHINGIKTDNRVENLEWCNQSENMRHAFDTGLMENHHFRTNNPNKGKLGSSHHRSKPVLQFTKEGTLLKEWGSIREIERELGIDNSHISACCLGKQKTAGGFIWKYK